MWSYIVSLIFIFSFLPLILPESSKIRYYACFISYFLLQMLVATLFVFVYIFTKDPQIYCVKRLAINTISAVLGIKIVVKGEKNVDKSKKAMIVVNHQSALDVVVGYVIFEYCRNCTCVARKEVSYLGPMGLATWLGGFIFIDRDNKDSAKKRLSEDADKYFSKYNDGKILVFPEGTRNNFGGEFLEFKKGAFFLAIDKQVPIFPVVISPLDFVKPNEYFKKGRIIISFLKPISTEGMVAKDVDVLIEKTRKVMLEEYKILRNEVNRI